ncbi:MAG: hypothetical protein C0478_06450 [Planctomyces sp.]|nr:hypothetical protein [Planctomyces sp.]
MNYNAFLLACSGPGAMETIYQNIAIGRMCAAIAAILVLAMLYDYCRRPGGSIPLILAALLLAIHPAWTISAIHGDCGHTLRDASYIVSATIGVIMIYHVYSTWRPRNLSNANTPMTI